jgi:hypothetical protein
MSPHKLRNHSIRDFAEPDTERLAAASHPRQPTELSRRVSYAVRSMYRPLRIEICSETESKEI